jgi:hypothetical protein
MALDLVLILAMSDYCLVHVVSWIKSQSPRKSSLINNMPIMLHPNIIRQIGQRA